MLEKLWHLDGDIVNRIFRALDHDAAEWKIWLKLLEKKSQTLIFVFEFAVMKTVSKALLIRDSEKSKTYFFLIVHVFVEW